MRSLQHYGLWVKNKGCVRLITYDRITHIHHKSGFSYICVRNNVLGKIRIPLDELERQFPCNDFFRIRRNYIINKHYIMKCDHLLRFVITKEDEKITISKRKKDKFLKFLIKNA